MSDPASRNGPPMAAPANDWASYVRPRLSSLRLSPTRESEIIEELSQHLEERYEELRRDGSGADEARRLAIEELLEPEALALFMRSLRQANAPRPITPGAPRRRLLADLALDLRYAIRMLRKQPGFAAAAVITLALGIGANSAIFALVDATLLRPLPLPAPDRLVMLAERTDAVRTSPISPLNLRDWQERNRSFEVVAGFTPNVGSMVMAGADAGAETVARQWVTAGFFDALGVRPIVGRTFLASDDIQDSNVVVLSEGFWRSRFGADPGIVATDIRLDGTLYTVVGVAPDEAHLLGRTALWAMTPIHGAPPGARRAYFFQGIGRLQPGVTLEAADADLSAVAATLAREFPQTNEGRGVTLEPMDEALIGGELRQTAMLFLGVVAFVLLICCANVANLLLARATGRTRELAVRTALGADRARVARQLVTESVVLAFLGGVLGLGLGAAILDAAPALLPEGLLPPAVSLQFDRRLVAFCAGAALLVGLLFGLAPAWQATRIAPAQALAANGRTTTGSGTRLRSALVGGQIATAVLLLFGAGLLLRTLLAVEGADPGYRAERVLTMVVDPHSSRYRTDAARLQFYEAVTDEVLAIPGVRGVAWATTLPLGPSFEGTSFFDIVGDPPPAESQPPSADYQIVSTTYFDTLEVPIVAGRGFDGRDIADGLPVCLVNEAFVRRYLQGRSPVGLQVALRPTPDAPAVVREIVGVARQVKGQPNETEDLVQVYVPLAQDTPGDIFLMMRPAAGRAEALAPSVRSAIGRIDKDQIVGVRNVQTLEDVAWAATGRHRFRAVLVMAFAGLALVLAMVGVFGVLAYSVQQRTRDFAVRRALGATTADVCRTVIGSALPVIAAGAAVGLGLSAILGRLLATLLFGVEPLDGLTFALVLAVLALTTAAAIAGPARKATRIDPAVALRAD
ncbi:MAG: ABC transporter permease [Vicinamibacterales bacterium]|nr:ABC transporter permease [Vicinamibacterales bacterium]